MIVGGYKRSPSLTVRVITCPTARRMPRPKQAEPTAGDLPQPELSPRARAALSAIVRLIARQVADADFKSQG